jgi:glycosyltransferase involved in cell wall biosynthesis
MDNRSAKIKIVYILPTLDKGGAERLVVDLILNLDRTVFEPMLILFKRGGEWLAELTAENIPVLILEKKKKISPLNFWRILSALKKIRPDIVHTHLGGDIYGRWAAKLIKVPVIVSTEHNINIDEGFLYNILKRLSVRAGRHIIAVSEAVKQDILSRYHIPTNQVSVIRNGVDTAKFLKRAKASANDQNAINGRQPVIWGTMGRLSPQKGHLTLIEAWKKVDNNATCLIAGTGPLARTLLKKIKQEGLRERIRLIGPVADPAAFLSSLDAFVFPSLWEGLGLVILEAGLIGLPVVASRVNGITEIIKEDNGWLIPAGDAEALAAQINRLNATMNDPSIIAKTDKLRAEVIANFDIKNIAQKYQNLYRALLANEQL